MLEGFRLGSAGRGITVYALLTAMRTAARSLEIAELAVRHRDAGVVGFDIAGAEAGSPPTPAPGRVPVRGPGELPHHDPRRARASGCRPSGRRCSGAGPSASATASGSWTTSGSAPDGTASLGRLASYVRDRRIPLEMCPSSNVQTGAAPSIEAHPIGLLRQLSFRVTVNTDNRLMSGVSLSSEFDALAEAFGYGWSDIEWLTINAMKSAFAHFDERLQIINTVIKPGFATARAARQWSGPAPWDAAAAVRVEGDVQAVSREPAARSPVRRRRRAGRRWAGVARVAADPGWRGGDLGRRAAPAAARAARRGPGGRRGAGGRPGHPVDQAGRQAVGAGHRGPDGRPDHAGGRGHPGQGPRAVRQGPPAGSRGPRGAAGRGRLRVPRPGRGGPRPSWPAAA